MVADRQIMGRERSALVGTQVPSPPTWIGGAYRVFTLTGDYPVEVAEMVLTGADTQDEALGQLRAFLANQRSPAQRAARQLVEDLTPGPWRPERRLRDPTGRQSGSLTVGRRGGVAQAGLVRGGARKQQTWSGHLELVGPRGPSEVPERIVVFIDTSPGRSRRALDGLSEALAPAAQSLERDLCDTRMNEPAGRARVALRIVPMQDCGLLLMSAFLARPTLSCVRRVVAELQALA